MRIYVNHIRLLDLVRCLEKLFGLSSCRTWRVEAGLTNFEEIAHYPFLSVPRLDLKRFQLGPCYSQTQTVALHSHEQILSGFGCLSELARLLG
jgi:hypothetical protein